MEENWKCVYTADKLYKVDLIKGHLDKAGIKSIILNEKDSEFLVGDVELFVDESDVDKAKKIIAQHNI
jgi:hypothetical protein